MNDAAQSQGPQTLQAPTSSRGNGRANDRPAGRRRLLLLLAVLLAIGAAVAGGFWYVWSLTHETTDDAQVEGHVHAIASKVPGYVAEVRVRDNQVVAAGDVLVRIRPDDYQARVRLGEAQAATAAADLQAAEANVAVLKRSTEAAIVQARAAVQQAEAQLEASRKDASGAESKLTAATAARDQALAQITAAQAEFDYAVFNLGRITGLHTREEAATAEARLAEASHQSTEAKVRAAREATNLASAQVVGARYALEASRVAILIAQAAVEQRKAALEQAMTGPDQVRVAEAKTQVARANLQAAQAQLDLARIDLDYCSIKAPSAGVVSKRSVEMGQFVQPGQPFLAIVPLDTTWVVANFKETQLKDMRAGHPTLLQVDAYPDHPFRGVIDSIAAGTGGRFSILPPENATGNFVKVVQRIPVKIVLPEAERNAERPLRPGMNVVVTVDTGKRTRVASSAPAQ
jgi:membrane fusion protein, multidrug efflux system